MEKLSFFSRIDLETASSQCLGHLEETGLVHPGNKKRYLSITMALIDAVNGSVGAMSPAIFLCSLDPYLKEIKTRITPYDLSRILASIEKMVMEQHPDAVQARFLWSLFHQARTIMMNISGDGMANAATLSALEKEIAERKRVEEELRESERKFRDIAELAPQVIFELDTDVMITFTNKQALELFGYTEEDMQKGVSAYDLFPDYERGAARDNIRKTIAGERGTTGYEYTAQRKDGTTFPAIIYTTTIFKDGKHTGFRGILVDITQLKNAEEELRERELRYRDLAESMPQVIFEMDEKGTLTFANRQAYKIYGYSEEDFNAGINAWSLVAPQDLPAIKEGLRKIAEGGPPTGNEYTAIKKDGSLFPISTHVTRIMKDGCLMGYRGIIIDITERKKAEEALMKSEERFRRYFEVPLIGVAIVSPEGQWLEVNDKFCDMVGFSRNELLGMKWQDITPAEDLPGELASYESFLKGPLDLVAAREKRYRRQDGAIIDVILSTHCVRKSDGSPDYLMSVIQDITERKHLESQLMHSQKMEAIGTLAGGVAHDFNNLLSAIMGYASLLQMKIDRDSPLHSYVSHILTSSEKAANLTHSLLAFSRKQVIDLKPFVVNDAVEKLHRLLLRLIPEDVEFRIDKAPERLIALGDSGQIDQVIMNLVTNARDAMPRGGKLIISVNYTMIDSGFITTHGFGRPGEYAVITVSDTGAGMDEKTMEKIFEPFFTTKEVGRGTGLGLAIVYGIIKQHNGYIEVDSRPGEGSTFSVYLPLVWLEPMDEAIDEEIVGGSETILIAEDNNELRALSVNVLEDNGYKVFAVRDGAEAVEAFRQHQSDIALTILDVVMPKMNGREAFEAIKKLDPSVKVIFASGYTDDIIEEKGMANGKYDFLGKPMTPGTLLKKIREILDRE